MASGCATEAYNNRYGRSVNCVLTGGFFQKSDGATDESEELFEPAHNITVGALYSEEISAEPGTENRICEAWRKSSVSRALTLSVNTLNTER